METITELLQQGLGLLAALKINAMYVLLWVAAGYIQKTYFEGVTRLNEAWKTLILGSLFSLCYALLLRPITQRHTWVEFFASYIFATSLYELLLKDLVNRVLKYIRSFYEAKLRL